MNRGIQIDSFPLHYTHIHIYIYIYIFAHKYNNNENNIKRTHAVISGYDHDIE